MKFVGLIQIHGEKEGQREYLALTENGAVYRGREVGSGAPDEWHTHWKIWGNVQEQCKCGMDRD